MELDRNQIEKAVRALFKIESKQALEKKSPDTLIEDDPTTIWLTLSLRHLPTTPSLKPIRIPLPHSIHASPPSVCLFTKDPQKEYKELLKEQGVKVDKVIGVTKLRQKYKPHEAKRALLAMYDVFLTDDRVAPLLPKLIGKHFFLKKKNPAPVSFERGIKKEIEEASKAAYIHLRNGSCIAVRIGTTAHTQEQIVDNIMEGCAKMAAKLPCGKEKNVMAIMLKTTDSMALPIWNADPMEQLDPSILAPKEDKERHPDQDFAIRLLKRLKREVKDEV